MPCYAWSLKGVKEPFVLMQGSQLKPNVKCAHDRQEIEEKETEAAKDLSQAWENIRAGEWKMRE